MAFSIHDIRDLDLMIKLAGQGASGAKAGEIASEYGVNEDGARKIASRLTWMATFGMLHRSQKGIWTISPGGERVIESKVRAASWDHVERLPDEALIDVMAHVTNRFQHGDTIIAHMLRREFAYGTSPRRRS